MKKNEQTDLEEKKVNEEENTSKEDVKEEKEENKALKEIVRLSKKLEESKTKEADWKNKYYQAYADLDNTRKNLAKDHEVALKYRAMGFIEKLLPALDSFEMAFKVKPQDEKIKNYTKGFEMILSQFEKALADEGVSVINPQQGDVFDHNTMQAIATEEGEKDGLIKAVYLKGYFLKDRIVRPAMVIVTKAKEEVKEEVSKDNK